MSFKMKLDFNLSQKLVMSQRIHLSLKVLSMSQEELQEEIEKELMENPLLEASSPEISGFKDPDLHFSRKNSQDTRNLDELLTKPVSLESHLLSQMEMSFLPKRVKMLLPIMIASLDSFGWLSLNLEELSEEKKIPLSLLNEALEALQDMDPLGVGARDLKECLFIQLRNKKAPATAFSIVSEHLIWLKESRYKSIACDLGISLLKTKKLCNLIRSLEPNPARNFSKEAPPLIRPDIYIQKKDGKWQAFLSDGGPLLRISKSYEERMRRMRMKRHEKKYMLEKISSAKAFIWAIQCRKEKLIQVASYLIKRQEDFLEKGASHIKPLKMQDMASDLGVCASTITRAIQNKCAETPQGMVALKDFFHQGRVNKLGQSIPMREICDKIKEWIGKEDSSSPLSDVDLRNRLEEEFQIRILRKSVHRIRMNMGIPSMRIRRLEFLNKQAEKREKEKEELKISAQL